MIAHISKRTARYLLISGLIPCKNSGKKTRNYKIALSDIIFYLEEREIYPEKYKAPVSKQSTYNVNSALTETSELIDRWREYYEWRFWEFDDVVTLDETSDMTGFSKKAILRWIKERKFKAFHKGSSYIVPPIYLIEYMSSGEYRNRRNKSRKQIRDIGGFIKWQEQK